MKFRKRNGMIKVLHTNFEQNEFFEVVENPYEEKDYAFGKGLMLKKWDSSILDYISKHRIESIFINISRGWRGGSDFNFLATLTGIRELGILVGSSYNIFSIENMTSLEVLEITANGKEEIDFTKLKKLKKCFVSWWSKALSIFELDTLEELYVDNLKLKDYSDFKISSKLRKLTIGNSNINNLIFLAQQQDLTILNFFNCRKIGDFSTVSLCCKLKRIDFDGCYLKNLNFLSALKNLEVLLICNVGDIESIDVISNLKKLKAVNFSGKTNVLNGDLTPLTKLPLLSIVSFNNRRHYSHKLNKAWCWDNFNIPDSHLIVSK